MTVLYKAVTQIITDSKVATGTASISIIFDLSNATDAVIGYSILNLEAGKTAKVELFSDYTGNNASFSIEAYGTPVFSKLVTGGNGEGTITRGIIPIPKSLRYCRLKVTNNNYNLSITNNFYLIKQTLSGLTKSGTSILSAPSSVSPLTWSTESALIDLSDAMSFAIGFYGRFTNTYGCFVEAYADPTGNDSSYTSNTATDKAAERALFLPVTSSYATYSVIPMRIVADYVRIRVYNLDPSTTRSVSGLYSIIQRKTGV